MSDIFLSYVIYDTPKAYKLSDLFQQQGWTVWMSPPIRQPGVDSTEAHEKELKDAKVIVGLWSLEASALPTVREALKQVVLAWPVLVLLDEGAQLPEFPPVRPFDLSDWDGSESHAGLQSLLSQLRRLIATSWRTAACPTSFEKLSLSEIQESARRGIKKSGVARPTDDARFKGVFISYRRDAAAYARGLYDRLAARFGKEKVFLDLINIGRGADFVEAITDAANSCAVMIALINRQWARATGGEQGEEDDYVCLEIAAALGRKIPILPVTIQGASMPRRKELPDDLAPLARFNAIPLSDDARWERDVEDLMKTLEGLLKD